MPLVNALRVERDGSVLRITLARPDRRNAFDAQLIEGRAVRGAGTVRWGEAAARFRLVAENTQPETHP